MVASSLSADSLLIPVPFNQNLLQRVQCSCPDAQLDCAAIFTRVETATILRISAFSAQTACECVVRQPTGYALWYHFVIPHVLSSPWMFQTSDRVPVLHRAIKGMGNSPALCLQEGRQRRA